MTLQTKLRYSLSREKEEEHLMKLKKLVSAGLVEIIATSLLA